MTPTIPAAPFPVRPAFRRLLGLLLLLTGSSHLTIARATFQAQVPRWVPLDPDLVVILSGIVELVLGSSLILAQRRRATVGWIVAAFFVAIFPGNVHQYVNRIDAFGLNSDAARFARLLLHPILVAWPLWSTGAWPAYRPGRHTTAE